MENKLELKQQLFQFCKDSIETRFIVLQNTIKQIQESLLSETKSSAGDKHETGRAMLQLEREKAGNQIAEIDKTREILSKIDIRKTSKTICLGSVVFTNQANYYIAISAGQIKVNSEVFFAISPNTPIGQLLVGKTVGDDVVFREQKFEIINVL